MQRFRAAVVQAGAVPFDCQASVDKACRLAAEAAHQGVALAVFPEAFISGYPKGLDFGSRVGMRVPEGREQFRRYWASAIEVPGPATELLGAAARDPGCTSSSALSNGMAARCIAPSSSSVPMAGCWANTGN